MNWVATAIFAFTYALIASRHFALLPIGRPAGALLGAVLMLAFKVLTPAEGYAAIDGNTLVLLFALMALGSYLERAGLFDWLSDVGLFVGARPVTLLFGLVFVSGGLSAFLLNDTVCLFLAPVVVNVCRTRGLPMAPYLIGLATSANIGSAATLVGNPQNIIIGHLSNYDFLRFMRVSGPAALVGLCINAALLFLYYHRDLAKVDLHLELRSAPRPLRERLPVLVGVCVVLGYLSGLNLAVTTLAGAAVLVVADRREPKELFARIDWTLIVFFACLFLVVEGFAQTQLLHKAWSTLASGMRMDTTQGVGLFTGFTLIGSNVFSNVPLVLLTGPSLPLLGAPERGFALLAFVSTVAGNLTLLGSVANLIVAEQAKEHHPLGFFEYLRFGLVSTVLVLAVCVPLVCWAT